MKPDDDTIMVDPIILDMLRRGLNPSLADILMLREARASCRIEGIDPQPREVAVKLNPRKNRVKGR